MDIIKKLFETEERCNYFKIKISSSNEIKAKIKILKKMNKEYNATEFHNRADAVPIIILYYFQIKVNELFIKYFEFKINYNDLKENINYLNDCLNEIIKNNDYIKF